MTIEGFRLSPQQKKLWLAGTPEAFLARIRLAVEGDLPQGRFQAALQELEARHEILRTAYQRVPGVAIPVQVVNPDGGVLQREWDARFPAPDLAGGAVVGYAFSPDGRELCLELSSLAADRQGLANLLSELCRILAGQPGEGEIMQYADVAEWFNQVLEDEESREGLAYWQERGFIPAEIGRQALPFERRNPAKDFSYGVLRRELSAPLQNALREGAASLDIPEEHFLMAAWLALLGRMTAQPAVTLGVHFDGRPYEELSGAIGLFEKYLPLQAGLEGVTFADLAARLSRDAGEAADWQVFYDPESLDGLPHFPFLFEYATFPEGFSGPGFELTPVDLEACSQPFHLRLSVLAGGDGLEAVLSHQQGRYRQPSLERLLDSFLVLLEGALADPRRRLESYDLLGAAERSLLLEDFSGTTADAPQAETILDLIESAVQANPQAAALVYDRRTLTYAELWQHAGELATRLRGLGAAPGDPVALCMERSPEMVVAILGTLMAGTAYLPIDPAYPDERIEFMLRDSAARLVVTVTAYREMIAGRTVSSAQFVFLDGEESQADPGDSPVVEAGLEDPAYIIYTSGSTGEPKGVVVSHGNLLHATFARRQYYPQPPTRFLLLSSFAFDSSVAGIFWSLMEGAVLVLPRAGEERDVLRLAGLIADHRVSHLLALPSLYNALIDLAPAGQLAGLKAAIVAGETCPPGLTRSHHARLPDTALYNEYGPTEGTVWATVAHLDAPVTEGLVPIGRPIPSARVYITGPDLELLPVGVPGELLIGGPGIAPGYLGQPELTGEKFVPNPFGDGRLYRTGDLARWRPDGSIDFLGRLDRQVKIRGHRVELGEIESMLSAHPEIREAALVAHELQGRLQLVAYFVPTTRHTDHPGKRLADHLKTRLPDTMVPQQYIALEAFPRTPNGKVDLDALPAPQQPGEAREGAIVAPRNDKEAALARVFREVLNLEAIGIHDNFFELGGDSIVSIRIVARANQAGMSLNPMQIFQHQTIAELAAVVGEARQVHAEQGPIRGEVPLTPIQQWFFESEPPEPGHANMSLLLRTGLQLDRQRLSRAVQIVVDHHDALRLRFTRGPAGWQQTHANVDAPVPVHWFDLANLPGAEKARALAEQAAALQAGLDISAGPTVQVAYFDYGPDEHGRLLLVFHHLATDVVSLQILLDDLHTAIQELSRGGEVSLALKTTSFRYWAEQQQDYARSDRMAGEQDYWLAESRRQVRLLPLDHPADRSENTIRDTKSVTLRLGVSETRDLLQEVPRAYRTQINEVLLTPLVGAIGEWTGEPLVLLDLEGHGREDLSAEIDLSRTVGWFTTLAPVVLEGVQGDPGMALGAIKEQLRRLPNRGIGYGMLRYLRGDESVRQQLADLPQSEINFNYLGKFDSLLPGDRMFSFAEEDRGPEFSPSTPRRHLLEVVALVSGGRLEVEWTYNTRHHRAETVERLARSYMSRLQALIAHCLSAGEATLAASDFPEADLSQEELDDLLGALDELG